MSQSGREPSLQEESSPSARAELTVMVVDDDEVVCMALVALAKACGVAYTHSAGTTDEALALLQLMTVPPDAIVCDLNMPDKDGFVMLRYLGELDLGCQVILLSASEPRVLDSAVSVAQAHGLDVAGTLRKPVTLSAFREVLHCVAPSRARARSARPTVTPDELRRAIETEELEMFLQPKIDLATEAVVGAEALVRWRHPQHGVLPPGAFLAMAEANGLGRLLSSFVLRRSLDHLARLRETWPDFGIAINFAMADLQKLGLPDQILYEARQRAIPPGDITVEVTETQLMGEVAIVLEVLGRLRINGIRLSIDDFGTGYSNLAQLQHVAFVELKIDRGFVGRAATNTAAHAIVETSVDLARRLTLSTVAEGLESQADLDVALRLGCRQGQGYFIARPMALEDLLVWLKDRVEPPRAT